MSQHYDLIVIGAGPGGYVAAIRGAQKGLSVALVEKRDVGGTCLNRGCIPTKTLVHTADLCRELKHADVLGLGVSDVSVDMDALYRRKDDVVAKLRGGVEQLLGAHKVVLYRGAASIVAPGRVSVESGDSDMELEGEHIIIATGSEPIKPPIEGIDLPGVLTSDDVLGAPPADMKRLVIIGGGVIGVEFASIFGSLGVEVTIIEAMDRLLPTMDKEISQNLGMILRRRGINTHTGARVERIEKGPEGLICHFAAKGESMTTLGDYVLVAIGRRANTAGLQSDEVALDLDRGSIAVDGHFLTQIPGVYAIGDVVKNGIQLAHVASAQAMNAIAHICGDEPAVDLESVPSCIYTDPEIAAVGLTEQEAVDRGMSVKVGKYVMSGNGRSIIAQQDRGFIKVVAERESGRVLGAQLMCARATDLVSEWVTAIVHGLTVHDLSRVMRPHPTFSEGVSEAVESIEGLAIHIAPPKKK